MNFLCFNEQFKTRGSGMGDNNKTVSTVIFKQRTIYNFLKTSANSARTHVKKPDFYRMSKFILWAIPILVFYK